MKMSLDHQGNTLELKVMDKQTLIQIIVIKISIIKYQTMHKKKEF
jgi:hypothetical protein